MQSFHFSPQVATANTHTMAATVKKYKYGEHWHLQIDPRPTNQAKLLTVADAEAQATIPKFETSALSPGRLNQRVASLPRAYANCAP
jgi:hypothetical protein